MRGGEGAKRQRGAGKNMFVSTYFAGRGPHPAPGGLCADGHTEWKARPSPLFGALIATRYRASSRHL